MQKNKETWLPLLSILIAIAVSGYSIYISGERALTSLESTLLQIFILLFGIVGSFYIGKLSAVNAAKQIIKPHARSAFRRLISLYESLSRVAYEIQDPNKNQSKEITIARMEAIVVEQLSTADDSLEDWRDLVPEDVEELRAKLKKHSSNKG